MIKFVTFRILRWRLKSILPKVSPRLYNKLFNLTYKFFYILKPSQLLIIVLALWNRTEFKKFVSIPSMFMLFNTLFSESESLDSKFDIKTLNTKLDSNNFTDSENNWESFFLIIIILAILKRFINSLFKVLWFPFKIALVFYVLKYLGFYFSNLFNILNNLSLGIIDWFFIKIADFF